MADRHDLLIRGGRIVSVFTGELFAADLAIRGETISAVLPPGSRVEADDVLEADGLIVAPGYVDAHLHVESTFVTPAAFAWLTLPRGTTTVLADPHEIVNVAGKPGLRWMIEAGRGTPQTILYGVPSCVPALPGFETAGATLSPADVGELLDWPGVIALGEVMDYRAVVAGDPRMLGVIGAARARGRLIDGHCPGLSGADLSAYLAAGIDSDHTRNSVEVSLEKARLGVLLQLQEKSIRPELIEALMTLPLRPPLCLVTDDLAPDAVADPRRGHLDHLARRAVEAGLPPLEALRAITYTPAQRLRRYDRGLVSPGKRADLVLLERLESFAPRVVLAGGRVVARDGRATYEEPRLGEAPFQDTLRLNARSTDDFRWHLAAPDGEVRLRAIRANPIDTSTRADEVTLPVVGGEVAWEGRTTIVSVWERHGRRGDSSRAPLLGFELGVGAVATTYAHDSHNLVVIGTSRRAMAVAANAVLEAGGGIAVVKGDRLAALLPLSVGGLMSTRPLAEVVERTGAVRAALDAWGYRHANAFMSISTLSLPVSPRLKLTDKGLVDVEQRAWLDPLVGNQQPRGLTPAS